MIQILDGTILTPQGWQKGSVIICDNKIAEITSSVCRIAEAEVVDAAGCYVIPGGIELHAHGGGGRDFMEGTAEAFRVATEAHMAHGTTAFFPTLSSSTVPMIEQALDTCAALMADENSPVQGLHLEGPYFSLQMAGAQIPEWIKAPVAAEYMPLLERTKVIKRWDAAPELAGAEAFYAACLDHGCVPAIAHTAGTPDDVMRAYEAGARHATHFTNAMSALHKEREYKVPGVVDAVYAIPDFTIEAIADGIHVPPVNLRGMYNAKGVERMCLITDALACTASASQDNFDPRVIIEDGVCKLADRSALAGSIATMDRLLRTAVNDAHIPLADACRMISETPARIMHIDKRKGSLQRGKDADVLIMSKDLRLRHVIQMGRVRYTYNEA